MKAAYRCFEYVTQRLWTTAKGKEGFYQGFVNSAATGGRMIGPLLGGVLVDQYGMSVLLLILMVLLVVSIAATVLYRLKSPLR